MPGERKEYTDFSFSDTLEEITDYNLCAHQWEHQHADADTARSNVNQFLIVREDNGYCMWKKFANEETTACDTHTGQDAQFQRLLHAVVLDRRAHV